MSFSWRGRSAQLIYPLLFGEMSINCSTASQTRTYLSSLQSSHPGMLTSVLQGLQRKFSANFGFLSLSFLLVHSFGVGCGGGCVGGGVGGGVDGGAGGGVGCGAMGALLVVAPPTPAVELQYCC